MEKTVGKPWQPHGKPIKYLWKTHRKPMATLWKTFGKLSKSPLFELPARTWRHTSGLPRADSADDSSPTVFRLRHANEGSGEGFGPRKTIFGLVLRFCLRCLKKKLGLTIWHLGEYVFPFFPIGFLISKSASF